MSLCEWYMAHQCWLLLFALVDSKSIDQGWTAMHYAAAHGYETAVARFLDSKLFAVDDKDGQVGRQLHNILNGMQQL